MKHSQSLTIKVICCRSGEASKTTYRHRNQREEGGAGGRREGAGGRREGAGGRREGAGGRRKGAGGRRGQQSWALGLRTLTFV